MRRRPATGPYIGPDARGVAAQAQTLLARIAPLAQSDADAWHAALEALEQRPGEGELHQRLTKAAHVYGSADLYVGDDGLIYGM